MPIEKAFLQLQHGSPRGHQFRQAILEVLRGNCIAYPTEGVYGLGCDPLNPNAIQKLHALKQCIKPKRLILVGCCIEQLQEFADFSALTAKQLHTVQKSWPGAVTWLIPRRTSTPEWITLESDMVAVRIPDHPLVLRLTHTLGHALTSTSANLHGQPPCCSCQSTLAQFAKESTLILSGQTMGRTKPSEIRHSLTGAVLRS